MARATRRPDGMRHHREPFYVRVATTANITIATALNAGDTIDGVVLAAGDRVLVKDQTAGAQNGIYVAGAAPARSYDMDSGTEVLGALILVLAGTANAGTIWRATNATTPTLGTTAIAFAEFAITVEDEGTPLARAATTLDFVGAGVTASGTGVEKTITIPGVTAAAVAALGFVGPLLISDTPSTPLVFADLIQNEAEDDLVYADV